MGFFKRGRGQRVEEKKIPKLGSQEGGTNAEKVKS